jgi:hypothetical protein
VASFRGTWIDHAGRESPEQEAHIPVRRIVLKNTLLPIAFCLGAGLWMGAVVTEAQSQGSYGGTPYADSHYGGGAQKIPGRVECAYYDRGGEGVAYHDTDAKNNGSGGLNPADGTYLNEFRMHEGADTSYTKFHDQTDNSRYDMVQPEENQLYVGWTEPGEWFRITVDVARARDYSGELLYTSNRGGTIALDVNGRDATGPLTIRTTFDAADPLAWRQWHHWNLARDLVRLHLEAGTNVLTVHILTQGNMNLAYFDFHEAR